MQYKNFVQFAFGVPKVGRNVPESPRWMVIHGYDKEAETLVADIESQVIASTGLELDPPRRSLRIKQRGGAFGPRRRLLIATANSCCER